MIRETKAEDERECLTQETLSRRMEKYNFTDYLSTYHIYIYCILYIETDTNSRLDEYMKRITVFCGSSSGLDDLYKDQAYALGATLAELRLGVVYGGAKVGLMGAVASGALKNGGEVIGVLPYFLQSKEIAHENLTKLILVDTMHERKMKMHELSDGIIALPGGYGTLEELFEMLTWAQLGLHRKPAALLNIGGYFDPLMDMVNTMVKKGFLKKENRDMLLVSDNPESLLFEMENYRAPVVPKWISGDAT